MSALIQQQSQEWHDLRTNKIGSSDSPVIMEVSPWSTPFQLWEQKLGLSPKKHISSSMKRGIDLEPKALEMFSDMTGLLVTPDVVFHPKIEWMMASLDAIDVDRKNIAEIKCPGKQDHEMALAGKVPEKYFPQLQHQLEVCGLEMAYYFSFDGEKGVAIKVYRDEEYIKKILQKDEQFWQCMQEFTAPKLIERDYVKKEDELWNAAASEWISINQQLLSLEKKQEDLRSSLISMSQKQNSKGGGLKTSRFIRKGNIDYSKIPEIQGVNLEDYRKSPIECWKISAE